MKGASVKNNDIEASVYEVQPPYEYEPCPVYFEEEDTPIYFNERRPSEIILDFLIALPMSVYRTRGFGCCLCINILLCLVLWVPAIIHAVILSCI
uniref:Brain protein I3 n=1 Tax=Strongyloides papillosus TaxID=174720 RepID=A0A0N5C155_STREA